MTRRALTVVLCLTTATPAAALEGFGAATPGGAGGSVYHVTSLADSGPGTLRDAVSQGHRYVVFAVGGTIRAESAIQVRGAFVTIDGATAPPPGITLTNRGLQIRGTLGAHDVIVRHLRVRDAAASDSTDCVQVSHGAYNVVLDHVSVSGCGDGAIDITGDPNGGGPPTRDVTVAWSILAEPASHKTMLIKYGATRVSLHHNLFVRGTTRNPQITREGDAPDDGTTVDMRNNVVWDWGGGYGTLVRFGATANVLGNLYGNPSGSRNDQAQALIVCGAPRWASSGSCSDQGPGVEARAFAFGNVSLDGVDVDAAGTEAAPFPAPGPALESACDAAARVVAGAGAQPEDAVDRVYRGLVRLTGCAPSPVATLPPPDPGAASGGGGQPSAAPDASPPPPASSPPAPPSAEADDGRLAAEREAILAHYRAERRQLERWYDKEQRRARTPKALTRLTLEYERRLAALERERAEALARLAAGP